MSQIARAIQYTDTGNRTTICPKLSPLFENMVDVKAEYHDKYVVLGILKTYRIQLKLTNDFKIDELAPPEDLKEGVDRAKRQLIEAVFGEFRPQIRRIEQAIYDYNMEDAGRLLRELEENMFNHET